MNKKKLVVCLLVFVMVLSLALTALVGCTPKDEKKNEPGPDDTAPTGYKTMNQALPTALSNAVYNTVSDHKVNSLAASASLKVTTKYGESTTNEYVIKFGANVALKPDDSNNTMFGLSIVDAKANNANVLNAVYFDLATLNGLKDVNKQNYKTGAGNLYVDLGSGADKQSFAVNALSIKSVLKSEEVTVTDEQAADINGTVGDGIDSALNDVLSIVFSLGEFYQKNDNSEILFSLSLAKVFESAGNLLDGLNVIDEYTDKLGLALKSTDIKTLLPALTLNLHFKMTGAGADSFENAIIAGINAEIGVASKDFKIERTDGSNFIRINIDKDLTLGLDLDFKFGGTASIPTAISAVGTDYSAYKEINAINFTAGGELDLKESINVNIKLNDGKNKEDPSDDTYLDLSIPKGKYDIKIAADINPVKLLGMSFNTNGTLDSIVGLITGILTNAVKVIDLEVTPKDTAQTGKLVLKVAPDNNGSLRITVDVSLLGSKLVNNIAALLNNQQVSDLVNIINKVLPLLGLDKKAEEPNSGNNTDVSSNEGSGNVDVSGSETAPSGDKVNEDKILAIVAGIVKNLTIGVNDGSDMLKVIFENYVIAENELKDAAGNAIDTTVTASIIGNKTNGLTIKADIKGIVIGKNSNDVTAEIKVNGDGVTITAKSAKPFQFGDATSPIELPIDLVLTLNQFEIGGATAA